MSSVHTSRPCTCASNGAAAAISAPMPFRNNNGAPGAPTRQRATRRVKPDTCSLLTRGCPAILLIAGYLGIEAPQAKPRAGALSRDRGGRRGAGGLFVAQTVRSAEHTSELPSLMRLSYAVLCLKKK